MGMDNEIEGVWDARISINGLFQDVRVDFKILDARKSPDDHEKNNDEARRSKTRKIRKNRFTPCPCIHSSCFHNQQLCSSLHYNLKSPCYGRCDLYQKF